MRHEDKQKYLDLGNRVFVRALRDPNGNEEFELSEGEATDLLWRRELAACEPFIAAMRDLMPILEGVRFTRKSLHPSILRDDGPDNPNGTESKS